MVHGLLEAQGEKAKLEQHLSDLETYWEKLEGDYQEREKQNGTKHQHQLLMVSFVPVLIEIPQRIQNRHTAAFMLTVVPSDYFIVLLTESGSF